MNKLKPGDFCHFQFTQWPKGLETPMDLYGTVIIVYEGAILIEDNDGYPYLVLKKDIRYERAKKTT